MKQNCLSSLKVGLFSMLLITSLSACDKKGPAETAGENIDNAAETVMDKADDARDKVRDTIDDNRSNNNQN